jgi:hypothetical protein
MSSAEITVETLTRDLRDIKSLREGARIRVPRTFYQPCVENENWRPGKINPLASRKAQMTLFPLSQWAVPPVVIPSALVLVVLTIAILQ